MPSLSGVRMTAGSDDGPQAGAAEICSALQLCLPRAAAPLVRPAICAVLNSTPQECAAAALKAITELKEDWTEVVRNQAIRSLERRLDSLTYELQKTPTASSLKDPFLFGPQDRQCDPDSASARVTVARRRASHDAVIVLIALSEVVAAAHAQAEDRCHKASSALEDLLHKIEQWTKPNKATSGNDGMGKDMPSLTQCESAVSAISSETASGMARGLCLLGLPSCPLSFTPGVELRVQGHDIRQEVNSMIHHWVEDDMNSFCNSLCQIRQALGRPVDVRDSGVGTEIVRESIAGASTININHCSAIVDIDILELSGDDEKSQVLLARRASVAAERLKLLARLRELDVELGVLDAQLTQGRLSSQASTCSSSRVPSSSSSDKTHVASECSETSTNSRKSTESSGDCHIVSLGGTPNS